MRVSKRSIGIGGAVVAALAVAVWYARRPEVIAVETAVVNTRPIESVLEANGRTRVRERYIIAAPVTGRLERIEVMEGRAVRAGEVVARLFPVPLDSESLIQAQARIDAAASIAVAAGGEARVASAALEQRRREHARAVRLVAAGAVAPRVLEEAQLALVGAEESARGAAGRSAAADADLRQARAVLEARQRGGTGSPVFVRAPAGGRILRVAERSERIVAPGTPLLEIGDPQSLEIVADLLSTDVVAVAVGDIVRFPDLATGDDSETARAPSGRVRSIEPSGFTKLSALGVEEQRINVVVDLDRIPPGLGDGHRVTLAIVVWASASPLAVPRNALVPGDARGTWSAFVVRAGAVERRQVRLGHLGGVDAEVLGGLLAGDEVIMYPSDQVREGVRVSKRTGS